jgi:hypothetical protein
VRWLTKGRSTRLAFLKIPRLFNILRPVQVTGTGLD